MALDSVPEYGGYRSGMDRSSACRARPSFARLASAAVRLLSAPPVSWLTYGPDAIWEGTSPPQRELLMHQMYLLKDSGLPRLDAELFAERVQQLLSSGSR